jgi:hypothetical protein
MKLVLTALLTLALASCAHANGTSFVGGSVGSTGGGGGGGGGGACDSSAVTAAIAAHRTSGAAPLAVSFDLTGTVNTGGYDNFGEITYSTTFDDSGSGTWALTGDSKNEMKGPVVAHVFETAGTYNVESTATDPAGNCDTETATITVTAADTQWSSADTYCLSTSGTFTGCTADVGNQITGSDADTFFNTTCNGDGAGDRRCLFRAGETFTCSPALNAIANAGPGYIGAYGSGRATLSGCDITFDASVPAGDWRVVDITASGLSVGTAFLNKVNSGSLQNLTFVRVFGTGGDLASLGTQLHNGLAYYETEWDDCDGGAGNNCIFTQSDNLMVLGVNLDDSTAAEHVLRVTRVTQGVIAQSLLTTPALDKSALKVHGNGSTELVVSRNHIVGSATSSFPMQVGANNAVDDTVTDVLVDSNFVDNSDGGGANSIEFTVVSGLYARNNAIRTGGRRGIIYTDKSSIQPSAAQSDGHFYNNTCYGADVNDACVHINTATIGSPRECVNNLWVKPSGATSPTSGCTEVNTDNLATTATDILATTPPTTWAHFKLQNSAAAQANVIDQGTAVDGVRYDFEGGTRSTIDIGADEYGAP